MHPLPARVLRVGAAVSLLCLGAAACSGGEVTASDDPAVDTSEVAADADGTAADAVTLTAQSYLSEASALGRVAEWFYGEVETRTEGAVRFERYWDGSLVEALGIRDAVSDGRLDVGQATHSYHADAFPVTNVTAIPFVTDNVPAQTAAMTELYRTSDALREEWESQNLHLVSFLAVPPSVLGSKEPITDVDQLEGMQVRGVDRFIPALEAVGANPVSLTAFEVYESIERGVVDAYTGAPFDVVGALGLHEVAPHVTDMGQGNYSGAYLAMSLPVWESLDPAVQQTIEDVADEIPSLVGEYYAEGEDAACDLFAEAGGSVTELAQAEVDAWAQALGSQVRDAWSEQVAAVGADPDAIFSEYEALLETAKASHPDYESGLARCAAAMGE